MFLLVGEVSCRAVLSVVTLVHQEGHGLQVAVLRRVHSGAWSCLPEPRPVHRRALRTTPQLGVITRSGAMNGVLADDRNTRTPTSMPPAEERSPTQWSGSVCTEGVNARQIAVDSGINPHHVAHSGHLEEAWRSALGHTGSARTGGRPWKVSPDCGAGRSGRSAPVAMYRACGELSSESTGRTAARSTVTIRPARSWTLG